MLNPFYFHNMISWTAHSSFTHKELKIWASFIGLGFDTIHDSILIHKLSIRFNIDYFGYVSGTHAKFSLTNFL